MGHAVRVISDALVAASVTLDDVIALIEAAFAEDARGANMSFPVIRDRLPSPRTGIFGVKAGLAGDVLGLKAGGFFPANRALGDMPHQSTMLLFDPDTGRAVALVGANRITGLRTGAAGAVAAKHLSRPESQRAALIGCGAQGRMQALALTRVRPITGFVIWDRMTDSARRLQEELTDSTGIEVKIADNAQQAIDGADIVITATPGEAPVLEAGWIRPGMHITAVGSDTAGKRELDTEILRSSLLVVDNRAQAATLGETQHLAKIGLEPAERVHAELGEVVAGMRPGRQSADQVTVFDATGVTFQDLVVAYAVYAFAVDQGLGDIVEL